jgi:hypothetical protein
MTKILIDEAVRLVNNRHNAHLLSWQANACTELLRLHAENQALRQALGQPAPAQELVGFDEWWSNEGSQAPKPTDGMYEHCKRMCEIAWSNGAYRALEKAAQQKPAVAAYWAVVDWDGKHIQVDQDTMQLEVYETKHHAKANVNSRTKAMLVYISATPPAPAEPDPDELTIAYMSGVYEGKKAERKRIVNLLMIQHEAAKGAHNYWKVAANLIQAEVASDT